MVANPADTYLNRIVFAMIGGAFEGHQRELEPEYLKKLALERARQAAEDVPTDLAQDDHDAIVAWFPTMAGVAATAIASEKIKAPDERSMSSREIALVNRLFFGVFKIAKGELLRKLRRVAIERGIENVRSYAIAQAKQQRQPDQLPSEPSEGIPDMPAAPDNETSQQDNLWRSVLEEQAKSNHINVVYVVRMYQETVKDRPLLRLIQDIEQRIGIYSNILEEIKRSSTESPSPGQPTSAQIIKQKYEGLLLVPSDHLPNPWPWETTKHVMDKLRTYGAALIDIMAKYSADIKIELKIPVTISFKIDVSLSLSPSITLGIESGGDE